ncbi:class I SAM-dependent methyltransferase [Amnibacterium sp.]|uniref:class I SAM-dependent methyltransferase n=1 Tax=Amnibacterium sp. TaxID=1872496 RepID=UPI003F7B83FE
MDSGSGAVAALPADQTPAGWSDHASAYDVWFAPVTARFAADVVQELRLGPDVRFLDVGAGTGSLTIPAAATGADVHAVDFAPGMIARLRTNLAAARRAAHTAVMDGQALGFGDGAFDAAASLLGLVYFPDLAAGARELRRVLRAGGRVAVVTWGPGGFAVRRMVLEALQRVLPAERFDEPLPALLRLTDPSRIEQLLQDAGFADVRVRTLEHTWPVPDPKALFLSLPTWAASMRSVFQRLELELDGLNEAAAEFANLLRERSSEHGFPVQMLLATGSR